MCVDDYSTTIYAGWVKARKPHQCYACREEIKPGERYHHEASKFDGVFSAFKHCARCWTMLIEVSQETGEPVDYGLNCGEIWEDPPADVAALAFMTPDEAQKLVPEKGEGE